MIFISQSALQSSTRKEQANITYSCKPIIYMNLDDAYSTNFSDSDKLFYQEDREADENYLKKDKAEQDEYIIDRIEMYRKRRVELIGNLKRLFKLNKLHGFDFRLVFKSFEELKNKIRIYDQYLTCDRDLGEDEGAATKGKTDEQDHKRSRIAFKGASADYWSTYQGVKPNYLRLASTMFHEILHGYYERAIKHCKLDISKFPPGYYIIDDDQSDGKDQSGHVEPKENGKIIHNILNSGPERPIVPGNMSKDRMDQPLASEGYNTLLEHTYNIIDNFLKGCKKDD